MAKYLVEASYSQAGLKGLLKDGGTGRPAAGEPGGKSLGGQPDRVCVALGTRE